MLIHAGPFSTGFLFRSTPCPQLHHASLTLALGASGISHLEESPNPQKVAYRTHHAWRSICKDKSVYIHNITQDYGQYMIWRYIFNHGYCREMMPNDGEQPTWMHGKRLRSRMATVGSMNLPKNTLPETNIAAEDRVGPKRNGFYSKNPFLRCELLVSDVSGRINFQNNKWWWMILLME